jgi:hypothetical protein
LYWIRVIILLLSGGESAGLPPVEGSKTTTSLSAKPVNLLSLNLSVNDISKVI